MYSSLSYTIHAQTSSSISIYILLQPIFFIPSSSHFWFFHFFLKLLETSGIQIRADAESDANTKVSMLLECIHERQMDIEVLTDMKRLKLEQCIHLLQFESEASQVSVILCCYSTFFL